MKVRKKKDINIKINEDEKDIQNINQNYISKEHSNINNNMTENYKIKKDKNEIVNMENKSLDEVYEYISKDNKVKNKKKNKKRNKGKTKKNGKNNENIEKEANDLEDPIVLQFKNDINERIIFASAIRKIKPLISDNWIKAISSY